jgi:hypothetical protein
VKEKGYYWGRASCVGKKLADWEMMWCDGEGWWHVCEHGSDDWPIAENDLRLYMPVMGPRLEPPAKP